MSQTAEPTSVTNCTNTHSQGLFRKCFETCFEVVSQLRRLFRKCFEKSVHQGMSKSTNASHFGVLFRKCFEICALVSKVFRNSAAFRKRFESVSKNDGANKCDFTCAILSQIAQEKNHGANKFAFTCAIVGHVAQSKSDGRDRGSCCAK